MLVYWFIWIYLSTYFLCFRHLLISCKQCLWYDIGSTWRAYHKMTWFSGLKCGRGARKRMWIVGRVTKASTHIVSHVFQFKPLSLVQTQCLLIKSERSVGFLFESTCLLIWPPYLQVGSPCLLIQPLLG